jgi:hypothetical protein
MPPADGAEDASAISAGCGLIASAEAPVRMPAVLFIVTPTSRTGLNRPG